MDIIQTGAPVDEEKDFCLERFLSFATGSDLAPVGGLQGCSWWSSATAGEPTVACASRAPTGRGAVPAVPAHVHRGAPLHGQRPALQDLGRAAGSAREDGLFGHLGVQQFVLLTLLVLQLLGRTGPCSGDG